MVRARFFGWAREHDRLVVVLVALAARLVYGLAIHNPLDFATSDMAGYLSRARSVIANPMAKSPLSTFFPYGTHFLVAAIDRVFGVDNRTAIATTYAALGTMTVGFFHAVAKRVFDRGGVTEDPRSSGRARAWIAGLALALYPPLIQHGGFVLSETPVSVAIAASTLLAMRLVSERRILDALWLGVALGLGATFRPQILLSAAAIFVLLLLFSRRASAPKADHAPVRRAGLALQIVAMALPIVATLVFSAERVVYHTGSRGLVSTNGAFNLALGRCHPLSLTAAKTPHATYTPPPFSALYHHAERHGFAPIISLDSAKDTHLVIDAEVWQEAPAYALARDCVATTGPWRQIEYSASHLLMLWFYNTPWPTKGPVATVASIVGFVVLVPGSLIGFVAAVRRRRRDGGMASPLTIGAAVMATHLLALIVTALVIFGEARLRLPYDGILVVMSVQGYASAFAWWRHRRHALETA